MKMAKINTYIVCYDIRDSKRLRMVYHALRGFGTPLQYSVFICNMSMRTRAELIERIDDIINKKKDRVMLINLGLIGKKTEEKTIFLGQKPDIEDTKAIII